MNNLTQVLAYCSDQELADLASMVLQTHGESEIKLLKGPSLGLVMLRQQESVTDSLFNAGEILVTEVRLELGGQFGFGLIIGDRPQAALALALLDAALAQPGRPADELNVKIGELGQALEQSRRQSYQQVARTKVAFEIF